MTKINRKNYGFTLLELLVVIGIIAIILALAVPNFMGARQRARDSRDKSEMNELKNALRMYYNDNQAYPTGDGTFTTPNLNCDGLGFATGEPADCTVYMKSLPNNFGDVDGIQYFSINTEDFCLTAKLDNLADQDLETSQTRCASSCTSSGTDSCTGDIYCVCAD